MALVDVGKFLYPPTDPNFANAEVLVQFDTVANTFVVTDSATGVAITAQGQSKVAIVVSAAARATLATTPYIAYPIGTVLAITAWNGTASGVTLQKLSVAAGTYVDWFVTSTTLKTDTGSIGVNPL